MCVENCWKDRQTDNLFYIVPLLMMYAFVWDAIFHFASVQSLDGLSEFNGTGPGDTLLTISDQDFQEGFLSSAFQVEL